MIFLAAGVSLVLAAFTYVEGGAMFAERGGSSTFARHAFNELVSFIAGWAILIDYIIIVSFAAISVAHYLGPIWGGFTHGWAEIVAVVAVIALAAAINIGGFTRYVRQRPLIIVALADVVLQLAVIVVGLVVAFHPDRLTSHVELFTTPVGGATSSRRWRSRRSRSRGSRRRPTWRPTSAGAAGTCGGSWASARWRCR